MKPFLNNDFLLQTETAKMLYHNYAAKMPIIDYHCHLNPMEIANDQTFENITKVWLGGDHYKWRLMRSYGVEECYITGDKPDREKFQKWAETLEKAIGNPLYHWSHLELRRYFDYEGDLNSDTAQEVWNLCNEKLKSPSMSARNLIRQSNVQMICTTDDPIDSLEWHKAIKEDTSCEFQVLPAWRPDKAMNIEKPDYLDYLKKLSAVSKQSIFCFQDLKTALCNRLDYFDSMGCLISDHGLEYGLYTPATEEEVAQIFANRLTNQPISKEEELKFKTAFLLFCGREYAKRNWVMQLHYGCKRDNNTAMFEKFGPDTGFDCIHDATSTTALTNLLNALNQTDSLPRTILYSLNPNDNQAIDTIIGCFQDSSAISKIQHGSAWWFNDHKTGMIDQLTSLGNLGLLAGFVGMLTDSRSFLSYPRHEYFRRILCNFIGSLVENGEFPNDEKRLGKIVENISYYNAKHYFQFPL